MKCEHCGKHQKELHADTYFNIWVCDKCYSHTLNPYIKDITIIEKIVERRIMKDLFKGKII